MARTKRPSIPENQLSPQVLKKRKDNTESQRRRRLRIQEKSKQTLNSEQPVRNDGGPTRQQAVTPNSDFEFLHNDYPQLYPTPAFNLYSNNSATWLSSDICPATPQATPHGDVLSLSSSYDAWMPSSDLLDDKYTSHTNSALLSSTNWDMLSSLIVRKQRIQREQQDLEFMRKIHEKERILADLYEAYQDLVGSTSPATAND